MTATAQAANIRNFTWEMCKLWVGNYQAGKTKLMMDEWVMLETAKLVEAGQMSDGIGKTIARQMMSKKFQREFGEWLTK